MPTYIHRHQRARKEHLCCSCHRTIERGEMYGRGAALDRTEAWSWATCAHCAKVLSYVSDLLGADEYESRELVEDWEPANAAERAVRDALLEHRWRSADGALLPVPEVLCEDPHDRHLKTGIRIPEEIAA